MSSKKTVVLGASNNPNRYSFLAVNKLVNYGHSVVAVGIKKGSIKDIEIKNGTPAVDYVDTVTLYLNPVNQVQYYDYILSLHPKRIIFNPGTENEELEEMARIKRHRNFGGLYFGDVKYGAVLRNNFIVQPKLRISH